MMYLLGYTEALYLLRGLGPQALFRGATPRNPLWPCSIRPFGTVCAAASDLENGAIWPLNGLRAKKFHVFRIKGLIL